MGYDEMISKIQRAKIDYYQNGRSELTDAEYDRLVSQAERLGYIETVGAAPVDAIDKIKHEHPMLSLDKCHTNQEVVKFAANNKIIGMYKADGLTVSATYQDGVLTRLETRGDGQTGNDIMFHANSITNLPKHIDKDGKYVIDGECVIRWCDFEKINNGLPESERYSHPRNLAAGSLNQLDPAISAKRCLRFYAWDVIEGGGDSLHDNLSEAVELGFDAVTVIDVTYNKTKDIDTAINYLKEMAEFESFPIDGIVFKYDSVSYGRSLGGTAHHMKAGIAYKFQDDCYPTKLQCVSWQVGKTGKITPIANFDPVDINGVIVNKASLHNLSIMEDLGITNECTCYIKRANDVIPQIDYVDDDGNGEISIPKLCPECGNPTRVVRENSSSVLYCINDDCPGKLLGKWKTFVSKKGMDVDGLSEATLERFIKLGYLTNMMVSLYELHTYKKELYKLDGFGKKSIDNLMRAIEASKDVDLIHFLTAFSIPGVGEGQSKLLAAKYKTFDEFAKACDNQVGFDNIPGIGKVISTNIIQWWVNNHVQMLDIAEVVRFKSESFMNEPTGNYPLAGETFVVTGSVHHFKNRDELKSKIESLGGKVAGSVSKNTNYLINNDTTSTSGKNKKAQELNIPIISEEDFIKIIN